MCGHRYGVNTHEIRVAFIHYSVVKKSNGVLPFFQSNQIVKTLVLINNKTYTLKMS